jgi:[histone H3]-lysine36 N-dimethyltransferase SETMAR
MGWELLHQPSYSPDLASSECHLFWSLSNHMRGRKSDDEDHLISKGYLKDFFDSQSQKFYAEGIYDLPRRWVEVVDANILLRNIF